MLRSVVVRAFLLVLICIVYQSRAAGGADDAESVLRVRVEREIFLVFDPLQNPPSAQRIVANAVDDQDVGPLANLLGPAESVTVWYPQRIVSDENLREEIERAPRSPLALLNEVLLVRFREGVDSKSEIDRLRKDPRVLSAQPNSIVRFSVADYGSSASAPTTKIEGKYQWGMQLLRFPAAWQKLRGTAYVSTIDTGVQYPNGVPHPELARALRPQFSTGRLRAASGSLFSTKDIDEAAQYVPLLKSEWVDSGILS